MTTRSIGRRKSTRLRRGGGSREPTMWTTVSLSEVSTAIGAQTAFDVLGGFTLTEKHNISGVITVHGIYSYAGGSAGVETFGALGLIIAEDDALAVPEVPEPFTDGDAPWFLHRYWHWREAWGIPRSS